jgi:hypothetical protein
MNRLVHKMSCLVAVGVGGAARAALVLGDSR